MLYLDYASGSAGRLMGLQSKWIPLNGPCRRSPAHTFHDAAPPQFSIRGAVLSIAGTTLPLRWRREDLTEDFLEPVVVFGQS